MDQLVSLLEVTETVHVTDDERNCSLSSSRPTLPHTPSEITRVYRALEKEEKQRTNLKSKPFLLISGTFTCGTSPGSSVLIYQLAMMDGRLMMPHLKRQAMVGIYFCQSQQTND